MYKDYAVSGGQKRSLFLIKRLEDIRLFVIVSCLPLQNRLPCRPLCIVRLCKGLQILEYVSAGCGSGGQ